MAGLRVQGVITDPQGNAVYPAGVSVSIGPQSVVNLTNIQDYYVWAGPVNANEPIVTGTLIASCPGYANNSKTVSLLISFDHSYLVNVVDFVLTPLGALTGIVFDASTDNSVFGGAKVSAGTHTDIAPTCLSGTSTEADWKTLRWIV